ncbi:MAG: ferredoxin--NADP reductase [Aquificota bacterium]|nr:MAG: ferredoxin--NADP reductase [Aquificota bacterium]
MKNQLNSQVLDIEFITDNLFTLKVQPDFAIPDFLPGQYVALGLPPEAPKVSWAEQGDKETIKEGRLIRRTYSIASPPSNKEYLEFFIAVVKDGVLSPRLAALKKGDKLFTMPKTAGAFTLEGVNNAEKIFLFATGTGIAPYMSMLRDKTIFNLANSVYLIYGVRYETDFCYDQELEKLKQSEPKFNYLKTVSRPSTNWKGRKGYVQDYINDGTLNINPKTDHIFLCGNPNMVEDVSSRLLKQGFKVHKKREHGNLHLEAYW